MKITEEIAKVQDNHDALITLCERVTGNDLPNTTAAKSFFEIRGLHNRGKIGACQMVNALKTAAQA